MTDLLWMPAADGRLGTKDNPNYVRSFDAKVQKAMEDWVLLDRTAFYAEGGGQPSDVGRLTWDGGEAKVLQVSKRGAVKHQLVGALPPAGALVHGEVDWALRYAHMRNHTSQHLLSALVWDRFGAATVGNQIGAEGSRVDFERRFAPEDLRDLESAVNEVIRRDVPILVYEAPRAEVEAKAGQRALLGRLPQSVKVLRIVEILDPDRGASIDYCPGAGTHVARAGELGRMEIVGRESKGEGKDRVEYLLK